MKYEELSVASKVNCLREFITVICPYEEFEGCSLEDLEYTVKETLKTGLYSLEDGGRWLDGDGKLI